MLKRLILAALAAATVGLCPFAALATVTTTTSSVTYSASGATGTFSVPFAFNVASDLVVTDNGVTKTLGSAYTVSCVICTSGGSVVFTVNPLAGHTIVITRAVPHTQLFNPAGQGKFWPPAYGAAFDTLEMQIQQGAQTSTPLHGTGIASPLTIQQATSTQDGFLSAVDWNAFSTGGLGAQTFTAPGGAARLVSSKLADWVSILDFAGADPTGVADSTSAVALAYAQVKVKGGAIYFPPGIYRFNLTIVDSGISIMGSARGLTTGTSATVFKAADLTKPIIQVGDGNATVLNTTLMHFSMLGDGTFTTRGTTTGDGLLLFGARNTVVSDVEIAYSGGDAVRLTSSATRASVYNFFSNISILNFGSNGFKCVYGPDFVTATFVNNFNISIGGVASGLHSIDTNCQLNMENGYLDLGSAENGAAYIQSGGSITGAGVIFDSPASTDVLIVLNFARTLWSTNYLVGNFSVDGKIRWLDGTLLTVNGSGLYTGFNSRRNYLNLSGGIGWSPSVQAGVTTLQELDTPSMTMVPGDASANGTLQYLELAGGGYRIPGTFNWPLSLGTSSPSALWKNATTLRLHYRPDFSRGGNDVDGAPLTPLLKSLTYSASMTPAPDQGSRFLITATNNTAFTINAPTINAAVPANLSDYRLTITISNTSVGALGAATFGAAYHMSAWTQPGAGFQRSIVFAFDGVSAWYEISRTPADVPN